MLTSGKIPLSRQAFFQRQRTGMKHNKSVFHQLLKQLPRHQFQKVVDRHKGDHHVRTLTRTCVCRWNSLAI